MGSNVQRTIVVSGVSIRKGGTLTILRQCLKYLSETAAKEFRIIALVHKRELCDYPGIEYIEISDTLNRWGRRLYREYVTMNRISKDIKEESGKPVYLWFSLHDTTPRVHAEHQVVYCQTSFPFYKWNLRDFRMDFKIPIFAMFTRFAYRINVHKNDYLIVQAEWLRNGLGKLIGVPEDKIIVAPPARPDIHVKGQKADDGIYRFFYASTPDCHKNFETLCEASRRLEQKIGKNKFKTVLTIKGDENRYSRWLYKKWGGVDSIAFEGFMSKERLYECYAGTDCLVFPSRVETWGLPISEFMPTGKPMLLADLPYAHETSSGAGKVGFFPPGNVSVLAEMMNSMINGNNEYLRRNPTQTNKTPWADDWNSLFKMILK